MAAIEENLRLLREKKGWTKQHMADILDIKSYTTITKWENGENHPRGKEIKMLCELFNVSADYLLGIEDINGPKSINYYKYYPGVISSDFLDTINKTKEDDIKWIAMQNEIMGQYAGSSDVFFVDMPFTTMNRTIAPGSKICIKLCNTFNDIQSNDIVLFSVDDEFSIKRFFNDPTHDKFIFKTESTNNFNTDTVVTYKEANKIKLYGKVVVTISSFS